MYLHRHILDLCGFVIFFYRDCFTNYMVLLMPNQQFHRTEGPFHRLILMGLRFE